MTPIVLVDELLKFIKPVVANFDLQTNVKNAPFKSPQVVGGFLPEKKPDAKQDPPDYPYVIVRFLKQKGDKAQVRILAGTFNEDPQDGWHDCMNVLTRINSALLEQRTIGKTFEVDDEEDIEVELLEEQDYPLWVAVMTIHVTMPKIQREGGYIKDGFE